MRLQERIDALRKEKNAVILAHNYQIPEIQDVADFVGDSLGLAMQASKTEADIIVFCGVDFMAESAKILNPTKTVLIPEVSARCPMAAMCDPHGLRLLKKDFPYAKVVSYVNTSAECKAESDVCCTSSNAVKIVKLIDATRIIFVPDENLASYVQRFFDDKDIIPWPGYCPTHDQITVEKIQKIRKSHPDAVILVHPECRPEVIDIADVVKSTEGMVNYIQSSSEKEFIIGTEREMIYRLKKLNPDKEFYDIPGAVCPNMKLTTPESVVRALENLTHKVEIRPDIMKRARAPLEKMMEMGRGD